MLICDRRPGQEYEPRGSNSSSSSGGDPRHGACEMDSHEAHLEEKENKKKASGCLVYSLVAECIYTTTNSSLGGEILSSCASTDLRTPCLPASCTSVALLHIRRTVAVGHIFSRFGQDWGSTRTHVAYLFIVIYLLIYLFIIPPPPRKNKNPRGTGCLLVLCGMRTQMRAVENSRCPYVYRYGWAKLGCYTAFC